MDKSCEVILKLLSSILKRREGRRYIYILHSVVFGVLKATHILHSLDLESSRRTFRDRCSSCSVDFPWIVRLDLPPPRSKYIPNVHSTFLATASAHDRLHSTFLSIREMYRPGPKLMVEESTISRAYITTNYYEVYIRMRWIEVELANS